MRPVTPAPGASGFTLIEALVVLAIMGVMAAVGIPNLSNWLLARNAQAAAGYYMDGLQTARNQAIAHNSASRLVLNENATSGQMEWRIDMCCPTPGQPCDDANGTWSAPGSPAACPQAGDGATVQSITSNASGLPPVAVMSESLAPSGATEVYFTPVGWLNTAVSPQMTRIVLSPSFQRSGAFVPLEVALTLAGVASRCDPNVAAPDPRGCPP